MTISLNICLYLMLNLNHFLQYQVLGISNTLIWVQDEVAVVGGYFNKIWGKNISLIFWLQYNELDKQGYYECI